MKKQITKLLFIVITICAFNVNADEIFKNEFTTKNNVVNGINLNAIEPPKFDMDVLNLPSYAQSFNTGLHTSGEHSFGGVSMILYNLGSTATVPVTFNDGYIKIDIEENGTNLLYMNAYGEIVKSNKVNNEWIVSGSAIRYLFDLTKEYKGKFYCLSVNKNNNRISTLVINENLEVEKRLENQIMIGIINDTFYFIGDGGFSTSSSSLEKFKKIDVMSMIPQELPDVSEVDILGKQVRYLLQLFPRYEWLADLCYDDIIQIIKYGIPLLKEVEDKSLTDEELEKMVDEIENKIETIFENNKIVKFVKGSDFKDVDVSGNYLLIVDDKKVRIMDKKGNEVASFDVDYNNSYSIQLVHDYVAVFRVVGTKTKIDIYNFSGNNVQTIVSNDGEAFIYLKENQGGFAVARAKIPSTKASKATNSISLFTSTLVAENSADTSFLNKSDVKYTSEVYSMPQAVQLNVMGTGNVSVANNARFGERVTLNVEIPEGQMLKKVRVYDANKKEITVENGAFLMPNSPVTIDAEFVPELKENPKTGIANLWVIGIITIITLIYYKKNKGKLTQFKRLK